jgi:hypothetical protein
LRERLSVGAAASIGQLSLTWRSNARRVACLASVLAKGRPATEPEVGRAGTP